MEAACDGKHGPLSEHLLRPTQGVHHASVRATGQRDNTAAANIDQ